MRSFPAILPLLLLVASAGRAEINANAAADVDIGGHCLAQAAEGEGDSSHRCRWSDIPDELAEWIFREEDEDSAETYERSDPGNRKCYEDSDVVRINGVSGAKLSSLQDQGKVVFSDGGVLEAENFVAGYPAPGSKVRYAPPPTQSHRRVPSTALSASVVIHGQMDANGNGCLDGRVTGVNSITEKSVYHAVYDNGRVKGPRWFLSYSEHEMALVGVLYQPPPTLPATPPQTAVPNVTPPFDFTGDGVAFIYPDFKTALLGSFSSGEMVAAKEVSVAGYDEETDSLSFVPSRSPSAIFTYDPSEGDIISSDPMLKDPYESRLAEIRQSTIPKAGQGVFVLRSVPNNTVVSYFNGVRMKEPSVFSIGRKKSPYLVEIGEEDDFLDVPEKFASTEYYVASTGHKINHKRESNGRFEECLHPRFGWIHCFISNRDLIAGEELFSKYDVAFNRDGLKSALKAALDFGHLISGRSRKDFASFVRPYLQVASKAAENFNAAEYVNFAFEGN